MKQQQRKLAVCACLWALMQVPHMLAQASVNDALRSRSPYAVAIADADVAPATPPATIDGALQEMFAAAAVVFTGEVRSVERGENVVTIRFEVEDGIRGVTSGETYVLREWSGLWADDATRYTIGQHLLMLLHAPSVAGFASPVKDGAIPLKGDAVTGTADLRWVALHTAPAANARAVSRSAIDTQPVTVEADDGNAHVDRPVVVDMLHAWQRLAERAR